MNVLLFGGSGLVGTALRRILADAGHRVAAPLRQDFDIVTAAADQPLIEGNQFVINAAVRKPVPSGAPADDRRVNSEFPHTLSRLCRSLGLPFIQISTDGVFSGRDGPYDEGRTPDPIDDYGRQKFAGEPGDCLVLRTSFIGPESRGFSSLLCWALSQKAICPGYTNHLWNGMTSLAFARAVARIIERGLYVEGIRHLYADDVSKFELLSMIAAAFGRTIEIAPTVAHSPCDRRLRTRHQTYLDALDIPSLRAQIDELPAYADASGRWRA